MPWAEFRDLLEGLLCVESRLYHATRPETQTADVMPTFGTDPE